MGGIHETMDGVGAVRRWMEQYRRSWEALDSVTLPSLFSSQGASWPHPFAQPVKWPDMDGLWPRLASRQCENFLDFDVVTIGPESAFVLYHCLTTHPESRTRRQGFGVFELIFGASGCEKQMEWSRWASFLSESPRLPIGKVRQAIRHLDEHLGEPLPVESLASLSRMSLRHATRLFRIYTGQPLHKYLVRQRVAHARDRLAWGDEPVAELAYDLGFASQAHLTTVFKRSTGFTPAEYRDHFRRADRRPTSNWLLRLQECDWPSLASQLGLPPYLTNGRSRRKALSMRVIADTPSTGLVHWQLGECGEAGNLPTGDGLLLVDFKPCGTPWSVERFSHWSDDPDIDDGVNLEEQLATFH